MIQRIQSVFLFLAALMGLLIFFFPISTYLSDVVFYKFFLCSIRDFSQQPFDEMMVLSTQFPSYYTLPLSIMQLVILILTIFTIFKYKKRTTQIRLNMLTIFLNVLLVGGIFYYNTLIETQLSVLPEYGFGGVFPLIAIILLFLANTYTRKDEKLIRSADRLR